MKYLIITLSMLIFASCSMTNNNIVNYYSLTKPSQELNKSNIKFDVSDFDNIGPYNDKRMTFIKDSNIIMYDDYNYWVNKPTKLIENQFMLIGLNNEKPSDQSVTLSGILLECSANLDSKEIVLSIKIEATNPANNKTINKIFRETKIVNNMTATEYAKAISDELTSIINKLSKEINTK